MGAKPVGFVSHRLLTVDVSGTHYRAGMRSRLNKRQKEEPESKKKKIIALVI